MKRRILASLLSLVMTLSLLPATALAEGEIMTVSEDTEAVGKPEEVTEPTPQAGDGGNTIETTTNGQLDLADGSIVISADGYTIMHCLLDIESYILCFFRSIGKVSFSRTGQHA